MTHERSIGKGERIRSLDVMRGITIVGMIVFNTGSGFHYEPLIHASWLGLTLADMAFPFFVFIMGITTYLSLNKYGFALNGRTVRKILTRTVGIILVCWAFDWLGGFLFGFFGGGDGPLWERFLSAADQFDHLRYTGVLVRLGLCYGICALLALVVSHKRFPWIIVALLVGYFIILLCGNGFEKIPENILGIVDRGLIGESHMCNDGGIDPEGVLSTIPSIAHCMLGFWVGYRLFGNKEKPSAPADKSFFLLLFGAALLIAGYFVSFVCPLSKKIWSPSFVMVTCGFGALLLGLLVYFIDVKKCSNGFGMHIFGANPLFLYLLSEGILWPLELIKVNVGGESMDVWGVVFWKVLEPVFGTYGGDLAFAFLNVLFCWTVGYILYRRKIFIKL